MVSIWADRLIDGDKWTWDDVPSSRKKAVKAELKKRVKDEDITPEEYENIVGEVYK